MGLPVAATGKPNRLIQLLGLALTNSHGSDLVSFVQILKHLLHKAFRFVSPPSGGLLYATSLVHRRYFTLLFFFEFSFFFFQ